MKKSMINLWKELYNAPMPSKWEIHLDGTVMMGAQASEDQYKKILSYLDIGKQEGAEVLCGGEAFHQNSGLEHGYYIKPTIFKGHNKMRIFQEEIFGPVTSVTTFKTTEEAIAIANDTLYGLGAGVWTRDAHEIYQVPRAIQAGRVWVNCYHAYPAHAPFGGYKKSGFGRENHKMMLNHYRQTKNMLISYSKSKAWIFLIIEELHQRKNSGLTTAVSFQICKRLFSTKLILPGNACSKSYSK